MKRFCYKYWRPALTTDCVIFGYDPKAGLSLLLIERGLEPFRGMWAFPGGFLKEDETVEEGAARELMEETGLKAESVEQFGCFSDVNRDPRGRVITIAFYALVKMSQVVGGDDASAAKWFRLSDIPPLAFDHDHILHLALRRLKEKIHFEPVGFELLPEVFTMPQLQALYESILEVTFDRRNFAAKMLHLGILTEAEPRNPKAGTRIPTLYRFNKDKYDFLKNKGFKLEF